jgi:hypothetical protein
MLPVNKMNPLLHQPNQSNQSNYYSLEDINNILFYGFNYELPEKTLNIISNLSKEVGSPDYIKTPNFQTKQHVVKDTSREHSNNKPKRKGKLNEENIYNSWDDFKLSSANEVKIETTDLDKVIHLVRSELNKLTDKNYQDIIDNLCKIINDFTVSFSDNILIFTNIFEIASTNRFYSKMYATLCSKLCDKYDLMKTVVQNNFATLIQLLTTIECVDSAVDYDKFCDNNKVNEKRKALATFYINLMNIGLIENEKINEIIQILLTQIDEYIMLENKKGEVDELAEIVSILLTKESLQKEEYKKIINKIANSKIKDYKSLSSKSLFKFMDMIDM